MREWCAYVNKEILGSPMQFCEEIWINDKKWINTHTQINDKKNGEKKEQIYGEELDACQVEPNLHGIWILPGKPNIILSYARFLL